MKTCTKCGETKELSEFAKRKLSKDGRRARCRLCTRADTMVYNAANRESIRRANAAWEAANPERRRRTAAAWRAANRERRSQTNAAWYQDNKERRSKVNAAWYQANKERKSETVAAWREANPEKARAYVAHYRSAKLQRTPAWANHEAINAIYATATPDTHVDHIIPLQGELVSGLHVHNNLQVLKASDNMSKSNHFDPNKHKEPVHGTI